MERDVCHDGDESVFFDCELTRIEFPLDAKGGKSSVRHVLSPQIAEGVGYELGDKCGY